MVSPERKATTRQQPGRANAGLGSLGAPDQSPQLDELPEGGIIGGIRLEAGEGFSPATRLRVKGLNVLGQPSVQEKVKLSITLDKSLVEEIRSQFGQRALSASINDLLSFALTQNRLGQLVDEMEAEAGPASTERHERVLAQWFAEE